MMHSALKAIAAGALLAALVHPALAQQTDQNVIIVEPAPDLGVGATGPGLGDAGVPDLPPSRTGRGEIRGPDQTGGFSPDYVPGVSPPGSVDTQGTGAGFSGWSNSGQ